MAAAEAMPAPQGAPPVCPFCRTRPATREHDCPADDMVICRCCPVCRVANCYAATRQPDNNPENPTTCESDPL